MKLFTLSMLTFCSINTSVLASEHDNSLIVSEDEKGKTAVTSLSAPIIIPSKEKEYVEPKQQSSSFQQSPTFLSSEEFLKTTQPEQTAKTLLAIANSELKDPNFVTNKNTSHVGIAAKYTIAGSTGNTFQKLSAGNGFAFLAAHFSDTPLGENYKHKAAQIYTLAALETFTPPASDKAMITAYTNLTAAVRDSTTFDWCSERAGKRSILTIIRVFFNDHYEGLRLVPTQLQTILDVMNRMHKNLGSTYDILAATLGKSIIGKFGTMMDLCGLESFLKKLRLGDDAQDILDSIQLRQSYIDQRKRNNLAKELSLLSPMSSTSGYITANNSGYTTGDDSAYTISKSSGTKSCFTEGDEVEDYLSSRLSFGITSPPVHKDFRHSEAREDAILFPLGTNPLVENKSTAAADGESEVNETTEEDDA